MLNSGKRMSLRDEDWRRDSLELYRQMQSDLARLKGLGRPDLTYYFEELTEALLDLKQAVIDSDPAGAWRAMSELRLLRIELDEFLEGEP